MIGSSRPRVKIKKDRLAAVAVTLAPILYFITPILKGHVLCPDDGILQNVPFRVAAAQMIKAGFLPLWDPYIFSGMPLLAAAQPGVLYPLNWFYLIFSPAAATNLMVVSSYIVAGLMLAAVQILPTFELLRNSLRATATYDFFISFSLPRRFVLTWLAPYVMGGGDGRLFAAPYVGPPFYQEMIGYVSILAIMLAIIAVLIKRDTRTKFWVATAVLGLLLALGGYAPLSFYKLIYHVPVLNLFRVPARHLMEVDFAIAVLAGRGLTVLSGARQELRTKLIVASVAMLVLIASLLTVTVLRPAEFRLARTAPVDLLHAPELFLPLLFAAASAGALWLFMRNQRRGVVAIFFVLILDLSVWGQTSGWYNAASTVGDEYWHEPETVHLLRSLMKDEKSPQRILTAPHAFDPAVAPVPPSVSHSTDWVLWTQPDVYMLHGIQNAAGYDGFGLQRYSDLAGRLVGWGELTDPDATLRGPGRAVDLLNVRYLISMRRKSDRGAASKTDDAKAIDTKANAANANAPEFPPATQKYS